ncbi:hypothetical protein ABZ612_16445 [Streptomyces avermitilis]|uniref:hypothetical protein n=1 Tax=Streptomyces avermitilis TaxID=33903 RepID=UPI0033DB4DE6
MVRITEEQVLQAEQRARGAEEERGAAVKELEANPYSDLASMKHSDAARLAAQLGQNARELRQAYAVQLEEERRRADRPALEKAAVAEIRAAGTDMAARWKAMVAAVEAAQAGLVALLDAGVAYNEAVEGHTDALGAAGLDFSGGTSGGDRSVVGTARLKVKGQEFTPISLVETLNWVQHRVAVARLSDEHPLAASLSWQAGCFEREHSELAAVPSPGAKKFPAPLRMRMPQAN